MNVTVSNRDLLPAIQLVSRAVSPRASLPILSGIFLEAAEGKLRLMATDLELGIETYIPAECSIEGRTILPQRYLLEVVRRLNSDGVNLVLPQGEGSVNIDAGNAHYEIRTMEVSDFPLFGKVEGEKSFELSEKVLSRYIEYTAFATATTESRRFLTGCFLKIEPKKLTVVGTDAYRLACMSEKGSFGVSEEVSAIIPNKTLVDLSRILGSSEDTVKVTISSRQVMFEKGETTFVSRVIEGSYPDYSRIIPTEYESDVEVSREELFKAVDSAAVFIGSDSGGISLELSEAEMRISSESQEAGSFKESLPCTVSKPGLKVVFKADYMVDVLRLLESEVVRVSFAGRVRPIAIKEKMNGADYLYLLMPFNSGS